MIMKFLKIFRIKTRKYWILINIILAFLIIILSIAEVNRVWSFLLVGIIYITGFPRYDMVLNKRDILRFLFSLWMILSLLIFLSSIREIEVISIKSILKSLYDFLIVDIAIVLFLGIAVLLFGVIPVLLLKYLDKKYDRVFYDIDQATLYIYQHLDENIAKKISEEEIRRFLFFISKKYKTSKKIIINREVVNQFSGLMAEEIQKILDLEKEYMEIMRISNRKLY